MRSIKKIGIIIIFLFVVLSSCHIKLGKKGMDEGIIKYQITYLQSESDNPIISLMPTYLNMSFKNNSVLMEVEGWMGVFKSSFIKQFDLNRSVTVLKVMNKKYYVINTGTADFMGMKAFDSIQITFDEQSKVILDFQCKHCQVVIPDKNLAFDVFYTDEIHIDNPNAQTPFHKIPGVMLQFQIVANGIPMTLIASEINESEVSDEVFFIPKGYEEVTQETIDKIFSELI